MMSLEEMVQTMFDRNGYDETIPVRLSVINQIKNRVLEIQFRIYNIDLELAGTYTESNRKPLQEEEKALQDELCWLMQDLDDVINRLKLPPIDGTEEGLNYKYDNPMDVVDPKKIADEKYPVHPWTIMPQEDENGKITNFDEWLDDYRIWVQSWNLNFGFVKGWEYAIGKYTAGKNVGDES